MTAGFSLLRAKMQTETSVRYGLERGWSSGVRRSAPCG